MALFQNTVFLTSALSALIIQQPLWAADTDTMQTAKKYSHNSTKTAEVNYLVFLPEGYQSEGEKKWPMILFLHGAGERGTNLQLVAKHGPPKVAPRQKGFEFVVVSPQCPNDQRWSAEIVSGLLDHALQTYAVDPHRVYLTGLSMGGYGTWDLGLSQPERFAAIAPICGGGETITTLLAPASRAEALRSLPVWAFHGAKDPVVPLAESERMVAILKRVGAKEVKLTVYPEAQHDAWTETYDNPEFYQWLLQHKR